MFPWTHPFGCDASSSLGRVHARQATAWNCEKSAVSFVMKYCPFSTTFRNPASIQNSLNLSCCDSFSIRSPYCCKRRSWFAGSSQSKRTSVLLTLSASEEIIALPQQVAPFSHERIHPLHIKSDCSAKSELVCTDNFAKNSLNRFQIGCIVYRLFSMSFAFELTSGQWTRGTEDWMSAFCEFQHPFSYFVPYSLWTVSFDTVPLLSRTRTNKWPLSFSKSLCIQRNEFVVRQPFFFIVFWSIWKCRWTSKWIWFFLWNSLVSHLISTVNCWLLHWAAKYCILGNIPLEWHWLAVDSIPIFVPMHRSIGCFRESYQDTTQNPKRRRPSCAEDW